MNRTFKIWWPVLALLLGGWMLTGCSSTKGDKGENPGQVTKIVFAEQKSSHAAPLIVAEAKGFFTVEGLNVEVKWLPSGSGPVINEGLGNKSFDAAHMGLVPALMATAKMPVTIVSGTLAGGHALVVQPNITAVQELRGKVLSVPQRGSLQDFYLRELLIKNGLDPKTDVSIVDVPPDGAAAALEKGTIDAAMESDIIALKAAQHGRVKILVWAGDVFPEYVSEVVVMRRELIQQDPTTRNKLVKAYAKAIEFIKTNPEETASLVAEALGVSREIALQSVQHVLWTAKLDKDDVKKFAGEMVKLGYLAKMPDVESSIIGK